MIKWSLLAAYSNPNTPHRQVYRFELDSFNRLMGKGNTTTLYKPGPQSRSGPALEQSAPKAIPDSAVRTEEIEQGSPKPDCAASQATSVMPSVCLGTTSPPWSDFWRPDIVGYRIASPAPKVPPDAGMDPTMIREVHGHVWLPFSRLSGQMMTGNGMKSIPDFLNLVGMKLSINQVWTNTKGVMAVVVASI